jgi:uncharacterized protein (TIGR03437 family)
VFTSVTGATATVTVSPINAATPAISGAGTVYSSGIAQNTWIEITGSNLVESNTQGYGVYWTGPQAYTSGQMTTGLNGVNVTVNGKPAYVAFYCSGSAPSSICTQDQINVLTPLDDTTGPVDIVVTNDGVASAPFSTTMTPLSPAFLLFKSNYAAATHADYTLIGPTSLYPGLSTPAGAGETIELWAVGFGLPATQLVQGSGTQSGALPTLPICQVGGAAATVMYAGVVSPGLYQINLVIPNGAADGDNQLSCTYGGSTTQSGTLISVSR